MAKKSRKKSRPALGPGPARSSYRDEPMPRRPGPVDLFTGSRPLRKTQESQHPALLPYQAPRQRRLVTEQRATTTKALATVGKKGSRAKRVQLREQLPETLRQAICGEYKTARKKRRATLFATGSAGSGRKNPGQREVDWRAEFCR